MAWSTPKIGALAEVVSGNLTLAEPAGIASGDLMVACIGYRDSAAFTVPGDWNLVATQQSSGDTDATNGIASGVMMWCVRGGSAPTLTFNRTAGNVAQGRIIAYAGGHATPYDTGAANTSSGASSSISSGAITTAEAGELVVALVSCGDNLTTSAFASGADTASGATDTITAPTNNTWIERADNGTGTGADHGLAIADNVWATASTKTPSATVSAAARHVMIVGAFKLGGPPSTVDVADASTASETRTADGTTSQADTSTGTETLAASGSASVADTSTATEEQNTENGVTVSDTSSASEAQTFEAMNTQADVSTASETLAGSTAIDSADTASATDDSSTVTGISASDSATATESLETGATALVADTGTAAETQTADGTASIIDASSAAETQALDGSLSLADVSTATDVSTNDNPAGPSTSNSADTATAGESLAFDVTITADETASALNTVDEFLGFVETVESVGTAEQFSGSLVITVTDASTGTDVGSWEEIGAVAPIILPTSINIGTGHHGMSVSTTVQSLNLSTARQSLNVGQGEQSLTVSAGHQGLDIEGE